MEKDRTRSTRLESCTHIELVGFFCLSDATLRCSAPATFDLRISVVFGFFLCVQINGIALDNKSLTECEALLRNCRDSLTLSLMKVSRRS